MIKEFTYKSSSGVKSRKVFVIKENDTYIGGIDLNLLSEEDIGIHRIAAADQVFISSFSESSSVF